MNATHPSSSSKDLFFALTSGLILVSLVLHWSAVEFPLYALNRYLESVASLVSQMWIGIIFALFAVAFISLLPKDFIVRKLGSKTGFQGLARATAAGVFFDLCSHGIVLVAMRLYKSGATLGQTMAFLVASPWNSLSLTILMITLFGFWWTILFIGFSVVIALGSGFAFDWLVQKGHLPANPATIANQKEDLDPIPWSEIKNTLKTYPWSFRFIQQTMILTWKDSKSILRWTFFGILLSSALKGVMEADNFAYVFGPSVVGLVLTILGAALIEVCSEGTLPIASDLMNVAHAPGNSFAFMMSGVSTDYSEVMAVREGTNSWKIALFLPLVTVPQIFLLGFLLNQLS